MVCVGRGKRITGASHIQKVIVNDPIRMTEYKVILMMSSLSPNSKLPNVGDIVAVNIDESGRYLPTLDLEHLKRCFSIKI